MSDGFKKLFQDRNQNTLEVWRYDNVFTFRIFSGKRFTEYCFDLDEAKKIIKVIKQP